MKRLGSVATTCLTLIATASAVAQQIPNPSTPEPPYGYYHHMWGGPWEWHTGMIIGPMTLLIFIGIVALIVLLLRGFGYHAGPPYGMMPYGRGALDILEERFAKGEIDKAEFEEKRRLLGR